MRRRAKIPPEVRDHLEWLGFVHPTGLVVSATALVKAGAILPRRDIEGQRAFADCLEERRFDRGENSDPEPFAPDFQAFARGALGWRFSPSGYAGTPESPIPDNLEVRLPGGDQVIRPDYAVRKGKDDSDFQLLVRVLPPTRKFDDRDAATDLSPGVEMERLLRAAKVPAGLLFNGRSLRLVSAPEGENSGWLDFHFAQMTGTAGRPICSAMRLLLGEQRLLAVPTDRRLAALLEKSRKYQNDVSERLAEQVLHSLYELLRGLQTADDKTDGRLLSEVLETAPNRIYRGLLTVVLRFVFLLYAEERDLLPTAESGVFLRHYSLTGLYERLREDAAKHPDTMEQRFGAWAGLLSLFRMVFAGAKSGAMRLPARQGVLFDPDEYKFLEGRGEAGSWQIQQRIGPPLTAPIDPPFIPDGAIHRALENLLVLDGERVSYRALDVEHIGTVYETMMGFRLEQAKGRSRAIRAGKKSGAPAVLNFDELLAAPPRERAAFLRKRSDRKLTLKQEAALRGATTMDALDTALDSVTDKAATPEAVTAGQMILQPTNERRRSGTHYTPRSLTEPIVRRTLEPILARLRDDEVTAPCPSAILDLKVCDLAMGSGAFLVEACRQLGKLLTESWRHHGGRPAIPPDQDEGTVARRLVARRCLYGVDRNPIAVDLAKLSLWLATLSKDHPLTFVDHALRAGDSLVGLSRRQIARFHWLPDAEPIQQGLEAEIVRGHVRRVANLRQQIRGAPDDSDDLLRGLEHEARDEVAEVTLFGDMVLTAFFDSSRPASREAKHRELARAVFGGRAADFRDEIEQRRHDDSPLAPLHWEIEFPEVFEREDSGFDAIFGNPPFAGKNTMTRANVSGYPHWLKEVHPQSHGNSDLVAHFFRRAFSLLRDGGALGLIATNTIAQGDTRSTGLRWICENGGEIYDTRPRVKWPRTAAVFVSVIHIHNGTFPGAKRIGDRLVERITAFLFERGGHADPAPLAANADRSFVGTYLLGMGFTFDDHDRKKEASPLTSMRRLLARDSRNREVIFPFIGGEEVNSSPTQTHRRYAINFYDWPLRRAELSELWARAGERRRRYLRRQPEVPRDYPDPVAEDYPELLAILRDKVRPDRLLGKRKARRERWWQHGDRSPGLYRAVAPLGRVLVTSQTSRHRAFAFLPATMLYSHKVIVFPIDTYSAFAFLQSRLHEHWASHFGSTLGVGPVYTPSDCFETFPFPCDWTTDSSAEAVGEEYYECRTEFMLRTNIGLTGTYNRLHDPDATDSAVQRLRGLHEAVDRVVLNAYGWADIPVACQFILNCEDEEPEDRFARRKRLWRYRWPDEVRDEVLGRLLALNAERAAKEREGSEEGQ